MILSKEILDGVDKELFKMVEKLNLYEDFKGAIISMMSYKDEKTQTEMKDWIKNHPDLDELTILDTALKIITEHGYHLRKCYH